MAIPVPECCDGPNDILRKILLGLGELAIGENVCGFTPGSVIFASSTGCLTEDNANFFYDDPNNTLRVGSARFFTPQTNNLFIGSGAGNYTATGTRNTGFGTNVLTATTTGERNTAMGHIALASNTTGVQNSAFGDRALNSNTIGTSNTAVGHDALERNTIGINNTAVGHTTLSDTTTGSQNTAVGKSALDFNITGSSNTAFGKSALGLNTSSSNSAFGTNSLFSNTSGSNNTSIGTDSGFTAVGANANVTGSNNTFLGYQSGPGSPVQLTGSTALGYQAVVSTDATVVLGRTTDSVAIGATALNASAKLAVTGGNIAVVTAGNGLRVGEGANAKQGVATLGGGTGTVVVANTSVTAVSRIFLTINTPGGTPSFVYVSARTAGTSFTIQSGLATDTSIVAYEIFEPA